MVYVMLASGFEEIEALYPVDILRRGGIDVVTVGIGGKKIVGAHGITVEADIEDFEATEVPELLVLPGGMPGATNLDSSAHVDRLIRRVSARGGRLAAICAAPLVLGRRGLLSGLRATCFPGFEDELKGAILCPGERVVTDGSVTTSIGMGAAGEFGLELLSLLIKKDEADRIAASAFII